MKDFFTKYIKQIIVIIIATLMILIIIITIHLLVNSSTIYVLVAPQSSTVHIDNHSVKNGYIKVTPGKHTVKAEKNGFETQTLELDTKSGETSNAFIVLDSNSEDTANWYSEHQDDALLREKISGAEYNATSIEYEKDFPIITMLPYETMNYTIDYGECEYSNFCIFIDAPAAARDIALRVASQFDSELGRYYYIFSDYTNPFSKYSSISDIEAEDIIPQDTDLVVKDIDTIFKNSKYKIKNIQVVDNYIITAVSYIIDDYGDTNVYRLIFQKEKGKFILLNTPELILTYEKYPNIPRDIIKSANNL
ncbi:hypothetical protein IKE84_02500 [Candidatus Saccharibacteria bacterium]|nr:hypothetical protein [Candidatus Saccharibacteria bacterium]